MISARLIRVTGAATTVALVAGALVVAIVHLVRRRKEGVLTMPAGWQNDVDINMTCDSMCIPCLECKKFNGQPAPQIAQLAALAAVNYNRPADCVGPYCRGPDGGVAAHEAAMAIRRQNGYQEPTFSSGEEFFGLTGGGGGGMGGNGGGMM